MFRKKTDLADLLPWASMLVGAISAWSKAKGERDLAEKKLSFQQEQLSWMKTVYGQGCVPVPNVSNQPVPTFNSVVPPFNMVVPPFSTVVPQAPKPEDED